mgnify:CR=1 FL=1
MHIKKFFNKSIIILSFFIFFSGCQLQEPYKNHGILFLENRSEKLTLNRSNKNDVIKVLGKPHIKENDFTWIYVERVLSKGSYHKLGQHVLKENNVLLISFDKYGVIKEKNFLNKENINKIKFSKKYTENELGQKSFVQKFLQSIQSKMYGNKK